ncbi:MAG TPA: hypothetical protein VJA94_22785 [Candidatus Angelobacter sp.]
MNTHERDLQNQPQRFQSAEGAESAKRVDKLDDVDIRRFNLKKKMYFQPLTNVID